MDEIPDRSQPIYRSIADCDGMFRPSQRTTWLWFLTALTGLVLTVNLFGIHIDYLGAAALAGLLTAAAKYFGVLLAQGEISLAYVVGILAIILLPAESAPTLAWGIFLGGMGGSWVRALRPQRRPRYHRTARVSRNMVTVTARVTLSFALAGWAYRLVGGRQPLMGLAGADAGPLIVLLLVYVGVYLLIFLLAVYVDQRSVRMALIENRLMLALVFLIPLPLVVVSAAFYDGTMNAAFGLLLAVLIPLALGLYWLSRLQYNLKWQMREMQALANIGQAVRANQDIHALLETVYHELAALLYVDHFAAVLCEPDGRRLRFPLVVRGGEPVDSPGIHERRPDTLIDQVLRTQKPLLLARDVASEARRLGLVPPEVPMSTWLGVPLLAMGRTLGMLEIASTRLNHRFGTEEQRVLNIIASATSAAIDNAQLYEQQAARAVRMSDLNTVLALLTQTLSPEDVLDTVITSASAVSEATGVAVYRYNGGGFRMVRCAGLSDDFSAEPLLKMRLDFEADGLDLPVVIADIADARADHLRHVVQREGKAAWVELPLVVGGQGVGAINLYFDTPQHFLPYEIELLRTFANQAAQAVQNADLYAVTYRALETRIELLSALAGLGRQLMATTSLHTIADLLLQSALEATTATTGAVLLRDNRSGQMTLAALAGYPAEIFSDPALLAQGITGRVIRSGQPIICDCVQDDPDYLPLLPTTAAQLSVPIIWQGATLGAITLESAQGFREEQGDFVVQLANQAVFAIENARLFDHASEARDRMQAILDTMTEALVLIDRHGQFALANPRVDLLGLDNHHLIGHELDSLLDEPDLNLAERLGFQSDQDMRRLVKMLWGPVVQADTLVYTLHTGGSAPRYIQRQVIPVRDESGEVIGVLLVFSDRTEQHNLERAREEFSQMIVHDLRSPLTAVTSSVELLSEIIPPDNEFSHLVTKTAGASQRAIRKLLNRVDSLLDISRMKSGVMSLHLEEVDDLGPLVDNVRTELEPLARELDIVVVPDMPETHPRLVIDVEKVERVLLNLVDNALKFSPRESEIVVRVRIEDYLLRVDVIDQGPGVPEASRQSIFERFVQIQNQAGRHRGGSGLGLNFCKLAVEAHGGKIWIEENPVGGSIFAFTLPIADENGTIEVQ